MSATRKPKQESEQLTPEPAFIFNLVKFIVAFIPLGTMHSSYLGGALLVLLIISACDATESLFDNRKILEYIPPEKRDSKYANTWKKWIKILCFISTISCCIGLIVMALTMGDITNVHYQLILLASTNTLRLMANLVLLGTIIYNKY